jgi:hypothetical protein
MGWIIAFYWVVMGLVFYNLPVYPKVNGIFEFLACMIVGGVGIPARLLLRLLRK